MNHEQARTLIESHPREVLVVRFVKRTTSTLRRMVCIHFPEHAQRATFRFNPAEKKLLPVWDCERGGRRFVSLDGVQSIKAAGEELMPFGNGEEEAVRHHEAASSLAEADAEMAELFGTLMPL